MPGIREMWAGATGLTTSMLRGVDQVTPRSKDSLLNCVPMAVRMVMMRLPSARSAMPGSMQPDSVSWMKACCPGAAGVEVGAGLSFLKGVPRGFSFSSHRTYGRVMGAPSCQVAPRSSERPTRT